MTALTADELQDAYREAEASLRLEGLDPSGDPVYEAVKARVIAGKLSLDEAAAEIDRQHQQPLHSDSPAKKVKTVAR